MVSKKPIFLAFAWEDAERVSHLHADLEQRGFAPWSKDDDLPLGEKWDEGVERAIKDARVFLACLSQQSLETEGFVEIRLRRALAIFARRPVDSIFVIPVRLDECEVPELPIDDHGTRLGQLHWVDLWKKGESEKLSRRIKDVLDTHTVVRPAKSGEAVIEDAESASSPGWSPKIAAAGISALGAVAAAALASPIIYNLLFPGEQETTEGSRSIAANDALEDPFTIEPAAGPGQFRDCGYCPDMMVLPAGTFMMGSPRHEMGRRDNEGPQREVTFDRPFAIGKYEVTFALYDRFADATGRSRPNDEGWGRQNMPVINVSRDDAAAYCSWIGRETGHRYSLPTEAEWEYAARAETKTRYAFGDHFGELETNFGGNLGKPVEVDRYPPNTWGLHHLHGNVEEWVEDPWHDNLNGVPSDGGAWWAETSTSLHVVRGGSWRSPANALRSAYRGRADRDSRGPVRGFRCATRPSSLEAAKTDRFYRHRWQAKRPKQSRFYSRHDFDR